jgi:murein L,D-transpeptidase YcbB/YkuD
MTDAFVTYCTHQYAGSVFGDGMNVSRDAHLKKINLKDSLISAISNNRMVPVLMAFVNTTPPYQKLKQQLLYYRRIAAKDAFADIPEFDADSANGPEIFAKLCKRLSLTGELPEGYKTTTYSPFLQVAVRRFQYSHGLDTTGLLTRETTAQLNIPIPDRIRQIELNMERLRWLPREPQKVFVQVNIPGFFMEVKENYTTRLHMRAIVGKEYTQTPLFYANMSYLVINPYWDVPFSIATKEMLPILKKDPGYLSRSHMEVYNSTGAELNPYAVNWGAYSTKYFPLHIRQLPGSWNSLGDIKFMFPNPYSVYLHGTPHQALFNEPVRAFSHGCMRLEDPVAFAVYLLQDQKQWSEEHIRDQIETRQETTVKLTRKLSVFVTYATCWVDDDNVLQFRKDVYGHDNMLARELYETTDNLSSNKSTLYPKF